jgi:hypothetical protein
MIAYRLFRNDPRGPRTLFHKHHESCIFPLDWWQIAEQKIVTNPGGGRRFRAGFHVFPSMKDLIKYCKNMDSEYVACRVRVEDTRPKPGSRSTVLLAKEMIVQSSDWKRRQTLGRLVQ